MTAPVRRRTPDDIGRRFDLSIAAMRDLFDRLGTELPTPRPATSTTLSGPTT